MHHRSSAPRHLESLEPRQLLAGVADADLFGPAQTVNATGTYAAAMPAANAVDGASAAFLFNDGTGARRMSISSFNASIHTLRFFDAPSYADRAAGAVTIYYSRLNQASLMPAGYTLLGTFNLSPVNTAGTAVGDAYPIPTSPADHPRASEPAANPSATIGFTQIGGLNIPPATRSILLDFGANPAALGWGLSEVQAFGKPSPARAPDATLLAWGQNVYQKTNASLKVPGSNLYAETANTSGQRSGGNGGFAFVWPAATQFRVLTALLRIDPATYRPTVRAYADELHTRYWTFGGQGGYRSGVGTSATRFYDDNAHLAVTLAEAYHLTGDPVYLTRAVQTYNYVLTGEDAAGGGGIYFSEPDRTSKDTISTLQAVRAALMLYQLTSQARYLTDATRLYNWAKTHVQQSDGLFVERYSLTTGQPDGHTLINSAGIGLSSNLLFYDVTGDAAYLREAQRIGNRSLSRYFNTSNGAIQDEGFWAFELVDALDDLHLHDQNPVWLSRVKTAMNWLRANREDPNGHYGELWGRGGFQGTALTSWHLNDQAAVARSYLHTAAVNLIVPPFVTAPGNLIGGMYQATVGGSHTPSSSGFGAGQYPSTESPQAAIDRNPATKYLNFGNGNSGATSPTKGVGTGFYTSPAMGPSIVTGIQVATADDSPSRDPLTVSIEGSNGGSPHAGASWTLIAENVNLGIITDPGRQTFGPIVTFPNSTPYLSYRVIIKSQRGSDIGVQYSELNLIGAPDAVPPQPIDASFAFSSAHSLAVRFSEEVGASVGSADLSLQNLTTGQPIPATSIQSTWDPTTRTARWTFPGYPAGLPDGNYRATIPAAAITDPAGNPLLADFTFDFFVLAGDANRDRTVGFEDLVILAQNYGMAGKTFSQGNFSLDPSGNVNFEDLVLLAQRYGTTLPTPASATLAASDAPVAPSPQNATPVFNALSPVRKPAPAKPKRLAAL